MHCHSMASEHSRLGVQRAAGLPECATPPEEVYALAKRRGMDFVTITDHDTIAGALEIADRPDVFVSVELTATFRDEPQAVHVLCYGITEEDHEALQVRRGDVELCAAYIDERGIACALAHPYFTVAAPLSARHRRRLAELFGVWEVRNGARARELNGPAATYVATRDGIGIGGSDDHAGVDVGRTFTEAPRAADRQAFLGHVRAGEVAARGSQGSAAKWTHAAIALAARSLGSGAGEGPGERPDPGRVMVMVRRLLLEADARQGSHAGERLLRRRALPAASVAAGGRARPPRRARADRVHAGRRLQPRRALQAREAPARAQAAGGRCRRGGSGARQCRALGGGRLTVRGVHRRGPLRPRGRLSRARAGKARGDPGHARAQDGPGRASGRRGAAADRDPRRRHLLDPWRHPHDRGDQGRAACPASRSRSLAPTHRSTGACLPWPTSMSPTTPACASACRACRRLSRPSPDPGADASTRSTSARPAPWASRGRSWRGRCRCRSSAATTPSSPPTPRCAPARRAWRRRWRWR